MRFPRFRLGCWDVLVWAALAVFLFGPFRTPPQGEGKAAPGLTSIEKQAAQLHLVKSYGNMPLSFEVNRGQTDSQVKFLSRGHGYSLFLTSAEAVLTLKKPSAVGDQLTVHSRRLQVAAHSEKRNTGWPSDFSLLALHSSLPSPSTSPQSPVSSILRLKLAGANLNAKVTGLDELPGKSNYFIGNDSGKWRRNVPTYAKVKYEGVYPGVDLVYYGRQGILEEDFVVAPGVDPQVITFGVGGAKNIHIDDGELVVETSGGELRLRKPVIYQQSGETRHEIPGAYRLTGGNRVGFKLGRYDARQALIIDPVLVYSSYLGGSGTDVAFGIALDSAGNAYMTGFTESTDFPGASSSTIQSSLDGPTDAFVTKINAAGSGLVYSTYLGGSGDDEGYGIAVDSSGNAYVTGYTDSTNFPGASSSTIQASLIGYSAAFVAKINAAGSALTYATYLGGYTNDAGQFGLGIAVDSSRNAYVTGHTDGDDFPGTSTSTIQSSLDGEQNAFVAKINAPGSALIYSTYLGGSAIDGGNGIAVDFSGNAYVTGFTSSYNFPGASSSPIQASLNGQQNAFVAKINTAGSALAYSTYLGGSSSDTAFGIAVSPVGSAYVTGETTSADFPTTADAPQPSCGGCTNGYADAFVTELNPSGTALVYSSYLGGSATDVGESVAVDRSGDIYVTGWTDSANFPISNQVPGACVGSCGTGKNGDAFVAKISPPPSVNLTAASLNFGNEILGSTSASQVVTMTNGSGVLLDISSIALTGADMGDFTETTACGASLTAWASCTITVAFTPEATGPLNAVVTIMDDAPGGQQTVNLSGTGTIPVASVSTSGLSFSGQQGTISAPQPVTLSNTGTAPLAIRSIAISGAFAQTNNCGSTLTAGSTCAINVTFDPKSVGTLSGMLTITDDSNAVSNSTQTVSLSGFAIALFTINATPSTQVVRRGVLAEVLLTLESLDGFKGRVTLGCSGGPPGFVCVNLPRSIFLNGTGFAASEVVFPNSTPPGTYVITFTGTYDLLVDETTATFVVR